MTEDIRLTDAQSKAINEIDNNLQIIACAGSGKTEVISRRIANILTKKTDIKPENIVAFTFTEKAAESLKKRIVKALGVNEASLQNMYIGTIHGFCWHLLKKYTEKFSGYKILDSVKNHLFVERYSKECGADTLKIEMYPRNINLFLQCIDKMIDDYDNSELWSEESKSSFEQYISCLYKHKYIDFSLMIFETLKQIRENPTVSKYLETIKYLIVDEYQDVNDLQENLIASIAKHGANVCVVGDDDQTIYQFRGSNANNMIEFSKRYENVHQVKLEENFRCTKKIVELADCVIKNNDRRLSKKMFSEIQKPDELKAIRYNSKAEEYKGIADKIENIHQSGVPYNEIAVLVRKGKTISGITNALINNEIPFETDSAEHFFTGEYFGKFVATLQILADIDKAKLYDCWNDVISTEKFNAGFKFLRSSARGGIAKFSEILTAFCNMTDFLDENAEDIETRRNDLLGVCKILDDYDEIYGDWQLSARVTGLLKFLGTRAADEYKYHSFTPKNEGVDAVQIMTVHKAKGLEFHTVFLPEMMKREFPVSNMGGKQYWHVLGGTFEENKDKYQSDIEDERKLFYVAVTRAKQNLYFTYELSKQPVSEFVKEAASSEHLIINRSDLTYNPKEEADEYEIKYRSCKNDSSLENEEKPDYEEEKRQREMYWATVRYAKSQLYDYYGTGAHFCPAMYTMLGNIKNWSPDQIINEAHKNGLI